jgi:hypothetical protein
VAADRCVYWAAAGLWGGDFIWMVIGVVFRADRLDVPC